MTSGAREQSERIGTLERGSLRTLRAEDGALRVCEPVFDGDPLTGLAPTLDLTRGAIAEQVQILHTDRSGGGGCALRPVSRDLGGCPERG